MGLKTYFLYAPIAFILPYAFKSREHFFNLIRRYLIMAIPVAVFGFVQIAAGPQSSLNTYVSYDEDVEAAGTLFGNNDLVRTSGTFSYISGYVSFLELRLPFSPSGTTWPGVGVLRTILARFWHWSL